MRTKLLKKLSLNFVLIIFFSIFTPIYLQAQNLPQKIGQEMQTKLENIYKLQRPEDGKWKKVKNKTYYMVNGKKTTGYFIAGNKRWYAHKNGTVVKTKGWFALPNKVKAYASSGGVIRNGVITDKKKMYYINASGVKTNGHFKGAGNKYYTTKGGLIKTGWNTVKTKKFYVNKKGHVLIGKQKIGGKYYIFAKDGVMEENKLTVKMNGKVVTDTRLNILSKVVMAEVGGFRNNEVYKAQAVAAHSWITYERAKSKTPPSVPGRPPTAQVINAVRSVENIIMEYGKKTAFTPYYAMSNGKTNPSGDFFKQSFPYLKTVTAKYDYLRPDFKVTKTITETDFLQIMDEVYGDGNYDLDEDPANWFKLKRNKAGYVTSPVVIGNRMPTVEYFYQSMVGLRSPAFTVKYVEETQSFVFETKGFGHGVGMSQWGAYYANTKNKWKYDKILRHYYKGVKLVKK